ncbi:F0F1 ATP synthase subunit alpha [Paraliomyxa miuraensis]|uniref:F0F1 ATP synthase subunit alpha n=1 Tax=Paraliomyxa miuraensis TaxID=376150 RepID=UPI00224D3412|nr:F0F1 ATP synthase subunit alpha [Paraliomyxa miuraensis]MCX4244902.1 F0F1 ATP synthase subunit alpha [Paraliomyxa miuraensis]
MSTEDSGWWEDRARTVARHALDALRDCLPTLEPITVSARVGHITTVADGVATAVALDQPFAGELVDVDGVLGVAEDVREQHTRLVLLGDVDGVEAGDSVRPLGRPVDVPAGPELIGRVVDPLGRTLDGRGRLHTRRRLRAEGLPTPLIEREPVSRPLRTGVFSIDTMLPIGRGQRQLVIGDRSTGKTELCLDILAGLDADTIGVYVAIGRRSSDAAAHIRWLRDEGFFQHGFAVVTDADDPVGLIHLAPYAATAMAEELAERGHDVVVVYDDLTTHAHAHRTLALLMGRPVGREAHPVDVFYAHARLLERATQLGPARGGGSITAFPIVETQAGDLTGYIPTNLVSITDGQIRLDAGLVAADLVPAVDVGMSVSRVGGKAQLPLLRRLSGSFKNRYAQFLELESFARFGTRLEASAQAVVDWGRRVRRALRQGRGVSRSWEDTVARLLAVQAEGFARLPTDDVDALIERACEQIRRHPAFGTALVDAPSVDPVVLEGLRRAADRIVSES